MHADSIYDNKEEEDIERRNDGPWPPAPSHRPADVCRISGAPARLGRGVQPALARHRPPCHATCPGATWSTKQYRQWDERGQCGQCHHREIRANLICMLARGCSYGLLETVACFTLHSFDHFLELSHLKKHVSQPMLEATCTRYTHVCAPVQEHVTLAPLSGQQGHPPPSYMGPAWPPSRLPTLTRARRASIALSPDSSPSSSSSRSSLIPKSPTASMAERCFRAVKTPVARA